MSKLAPSKQKFAGAAERKTLTRSLKYIMPLKLHANLRIYDSFLPFSALDSLSVVFINVNLFNLFTSFSRP